MNELLKKKISDAFSNNIVGEVVFSSEEIDELYSIVEELLSDTNKYNGKSYYFNIEDVKAIFVALVNASKEWGRTEDGFYDFLDKKIKGNIERDLVVYLINYLKEHGLIYTITFGKKYYATMLSHSLSPISSTMSFFDMCWEIFCKDLDQQYGRDEELCRIIVHNLKSKLQGSGLNDDVSIGSKVYSFRVGLTGILYSEPNVIVSFLDDILSSIDSLFNNEPIKLDKYSHQLLKNWWHNKSLLFGERKERKQRRFRDNVVSDYSQIKPKYIYDEVMTKIVIPSIRLKDKFDYEPYIEIRVNRKIFINEKIEVRGSGILMTTYQKEYNLNDFTFDKNVDIHIVINHCQDIIYDSKNTLNRQFILFRDGREISSTECLPGFYFLYTPMLNTLLRKPRDIHKTILNTYSFEANNGDVIQSEDKTVFFLDEHINRELYFYVKENNKLIYRFNGDEYKVIDGELYVDVDNNIEINDIGVRYEAAPFRLQEFPYQEIIDKKRFEISSLLNVGEPQKLIVFRYSDNSILASINLIKFKNIKIKFDKDLYYGKNEIGIFYFDTDKYHKESIFNIDDEEVSASLEGGEIIAKPPVLRWKIDDNDWSSRPLDTGLWYKSFTNSSLLSIDIPEDFNCSIGLSNNHFIEQHNDKHEYKLGQTIYSLATTSSMNSVIVFIKTDKGENYEIGDIFFKESFLDDPVVVNSLDKTIMWSPSTFIGDKDSKFKMYIYLDNDIVEQYELDLNSKRIKCNGIDDDNYTIEIKLISKGFLMKETTLFSDSFFIGNEKIVKYKNKTIRCTYIVSFGEKRVMKDIKPIYIDNINYLGAIDNIDYYSGHLFVIDRTGKKFYLNSMFDEKTRREIDINPVRIEFKSDRSCYLGYGLDPDDEEFEYDNEFSLDYSKKTTIGNYTGNIRNIPIGYFIFEVIKNV